MAPRRGPVPSLANVSDQAFHLGAHIVRAAKGERVLIINPTMEAHPITHLGFERGQVPVAAAPLNGVEDVDAHLHQARQQQSHVTVVVMEDQEAVGLGEVDRALEWRPVECFKDLGADQQAFLGTEIVGHLRHVGRTGQGHKAATVEFGEEVRDPVDEVAR